MHELIFDVALYRHEHEDFPDDPVPWGAEWGERDSGEATEETDPDSLAGLVAGIIDDVTSVACRSGHAVRLAWEVTGDAPGGRTVADLVDQAGIVLPDRITPR